MKVGVPSSPLSLWERARVRAIKGFLAIENFRVLVATSMDDLEVNENWSTENWATWKSR